MKSFSKTLAKAVAVALTVVMLVPANLQAATNSGEKVDISDAKVTVSAMTYTGKNQTAKVTVKLDGKKLKADTDYVLSGDLKKKNAGSYKITVTGMGNYTGEVTKSYKINKAAQSISAKTPSVKASAVKKKAKTYKLGVSGIKEKGAVTYKSNSKKITVNKKGTVTVKKGTKKGTTAKITITVAATKNYKKTTKTITIKVK